MFRGCSSLTSLNLSNFNTNNVKDMHEMFKDFKSLTSLDISNFSCESIIDTTKIDKMFEGCKSLKIKRVKHKDFQIRQQLFIDLLDI